MLHITYTTCVILRSTVFPKYFGMPLGKSHAICLVNIFVFSISWIVRRLRAPHCTASKDGVITSLQHTMHVINNALSHNRFLFSVHLLSFRNFVYFHLSGQSLLRSLSLSVSLSVSLVLCYVIRHPELYTLSELRCTLCDVMLSAVGICLP
jgi:hypothetical protein